MIAGHITPPPDSIEVFKPLIWFIILAARFQDPSHDWRPYHDTSCAILSFDVSIGFLSASSEPRRVLVPLRILLIVRFMLSRPRKGIKFVNLPTQPADTPAQALGGLLLRFSLLFLHIGFATITYYFCVKTIWGSSRSILAETERLSHHRQHSASQRCFLLQLHRRSQSRV